MSERPDSAFRLLSHEDDIPTNGRGLLIPRKRPGSRSTRRNPKPSDRGFAFAGKVAKVAVGAVGVFALALVAVSGYGLVAQSTMVATPVVTIIDPYTQTSTELGFGAQVALSKHTFFIETRDAFVDEGLTFIEVDQTRKQLRYFKNGVLVQSAEVLGVAEDGSWWDVPSGLYQLEGKDQRLFTTMSQAYMPYALTFESNFMIHGWPIYPGGEPVSAEFSGGGIRLSDESAQALFEAARIGTPILVHTAVERPDTFVYEPQVPELETPHYFIADIENSTILAASDLRAKAPIASVTKLMTAVVAAEEINLDGRVRVTSPSFVQSLIPRLSERSSVSMYSLLQLLLVESSNEAAEVIAAEMGREEFIEAMNAKARQLGMFDTTFVDPSGLGDGNVSSLGDLYTLSRYIEENRSFIFEITYKESVPSAYVGGEFDGLINFNEIEGLDNFVGGKVGETTAAGQTSVSLHEVRFNGSDRVLVVILLGSENRTEDIKTLIEYAQNRFGR